jgi:hypothetical protein
MNNKWKNAPRVIYPRLQHRSLCRQSPKAAGRCLRSSLGVIETYQTPTVRVLIVADDATCVTRGETVVGPDNHQTLGVTYTCRRPWARQRTPSTSRTRRSAGFSRTQRQRNATAHDQRNISRMVCHLVGRLQQSSRQQPGKSVRRGWM